ncbi:MAG: hypothetical protein AAFX65_09280 [Cyanobacteria bacterium J06638_7]
MPTTPEAPRPPRVNAVPHGEWLQPFIHQHCLQLGAMAWQGLQSHGRGLVVCEAELPRSRAIRWATEIVPHRLHYLPRSEVRCQLDQLQLEAQVLERVDCSLASYDGSSELVALMLAWAQPAIVHLRRMVIPPRDCDWQLRRRRSEFCGLSG